MSDPAHTPPAADELLDYWFAGAAADPREVSGRAALWWGGSPEIDRDLTERYRALYESAARGELDDWVRSPRGRLALVLLLDQLPRSLYRGSAAAFAQDARALELAREGASTGHLDALRPLEQAFLLMPYQHVEDVTLQREGVALFERIARESAPEWRRPLEETLDYARRHLAIVERFGRFPHRNAALGRDSTDAEREYLESGGERFGQ